jgi:hypothetical protein
VVDALPMVDENTVYKNILTEDGCQILMAEVLPGAYDYNVARPMAPKGTYSGFKGNAGRHYSFLLEDGTRFMSDDVWSSRAEVINEEFNITGDDRLIEVSYALKDNRRVTYTGCITVGFYKEACKHAGIYFNEKNQCPSASEDKLSKRVRLSRLLKDLESIKNWKADSRFCTPQMKAEALAKCKRRIAAATNGYVVVVMNKDEDQ